jgi:phosphate transport system permease protein
VILAVFGILVFILWEVLPLASDVEIETLSSIEMDGFAPRAFLCDEYREQAAGLALDGVLRVWRLKGGAVIAERRLLEPQAAGGEIRLVDACVPPAGGCITASTSDGAVLAVAVDWNVSFAASGERQVECAIGESIRLEVDAGRKPLRAFAVNGVPTEGDPSPLTLAAQPEDGVLVLLRRSVDENPFSGEVQVHLERKALAFAERLHALVFDPEGRDLYGAGPGGRLFWWRAGDEGLEIAGADDRAGTPITALSLLLGGRSLVVGREDGRSEVWFQVRGEEGKSKLQYVREFSGPPSPVNSFATSPRDRSFFAAYANGELRLFHSTSERLLWSGGSPVGAPAALCYTPKADGACLAGGGSLVLLDVRNPHPEVSLKALFGGVWYEDHPGPESIWQSGGGTDEFEPKLSLAPLLFGTLKGTLYALFLAIPLGILSAMYTSQFMSPKLERYIKPSVELMAALPTVILGFLAGLWLAPRLERWFPALVLAVAVLPLSVLAAGWVWERSPARVRRGLPAGSELIVHMAFLALGGAFCLSVETAFESLAFGGDFRRWLGEVTGLGYDQRNAVVVGIAMGFAVIPIVFTISEDAFSSVPKNLVSGSLALGANRWQTVARVVLPSASPGVFAAVMVGFGRAVGETMIVLMSTGNTPIRDWSPFNGFRTLSANIAVEIPEAPQHGTLYRTLFLSALLLFAVTFAVNTAAEVVRLRLRKRYAQL